MKLGEVIAAYRFTRGIGVRGLAKEIGIAWPTLNRIERDHNCDAVSLAKVLFWLIGNGGER